MNLNDLFVVHSKLIGARYYTPKLEGYPESARDYMGHGSHTASTAAGNAVKHVSFYGLGNGTARGGVPAARIAVYKVCDPGVNGCTSDGILAAFDDAIADKVDLISISIGGDNGSPFEVDPLAIGAFHAMAKGILTINSAGNNGPQLSSVASIAPWIFTVAASNTNRAFITKVVLGNGKTIVVSTKKQIFIPLKQTSSYISCPLLTLMLVVKQGRSVNSFDLKGMKYPLVYGNSASSSCDAASAR